MASTIGEFDYVVVGGGSAGCAVAGRLSEDPGRSVALLEIGPRNDSFLVRWPAGYARLQGDWVRFEWETAAQPAMNDRRLPTPQGRILGGGSTVNSMVYIRGNPRDFDHWESLGNDQWSFDKVLPYFRKSEDNERFIDTFHGQGGPLGVSDQRHTSPLTRMFIRAAQQRGIPYNPDFNGERQHGVGYLQVTQRDGQRCSAAHAFIYRNETRPNLSVFTRTRVLRMLLRAGRAVGVEILTKEGAKTVLARREVILSAGAVSSPKLLLLSGIGPADELKKLGIAASHDLPGVGKNMHDHIASFAGMRVNKPISYSGQDKGLRALRHGLEYLLFGSGAVASNVVEAAAFVSTEGNDDWPNVQLHFIPAGLPMHKAIDGHGLTIIASNLRPKSRGEIRLASADPLAEPVIDPGFLSDPADLKVNLAALKIARNLLYAPAFASIFLDETSPGGELKSDEDLVRFIRQYGKTDFHPVGSCKMGPDETSVVSQDLKVRGLDGLRVADASIMPAIVSGNTNAASIMIGERGADFVLGATQTAERPQRQSPVATRDFSQASPVSPS
jgi:choline dehydrogenase-like flavoprotein